MASGLFIGMVTLDLVYLADRPPQRNEKRMGERLSVSAGGPACNAAVAFSALGGKAVLAGALGRHPVCRIVRADLERHGVGFVDLTPDRAGPPTVSSVIVSKRTGERAVMTVPAPAPRPGRMSAAVPRLLSLAKPDIALVDGHQMAAAQTLALSRKRPLLVVDAGSWKPGFDAVIRKADYVIASADFLAPKCRDEDQVLDWFTRLGRKRVAITHGPAPVRFLDRDDTGWIEVPRVKARDTMGAGDIFHGAFCRFIVEKDFVTALCRASEVASFSCRFLGTRAWIGNR